MLIRISWSYSNVTNITAIVVILVTIKTFMYQGQQVCLLQPATGGCSGEQDTENDPSSHLVEKAISHQVSKNEKEMIEFSHASVIFF